MKDLIKCGTLALRGIRGQSWNTGDPSTAKSTPQISWLAVTFSLFKVCPSHSRGTPPLAKVSSVAMSSSLVIRKRGSINGKEEASFPLRSLKEALQLRIEMGSKL